MTAAPTQPGFWRTVGILLGAARRRSRGRRERQRQLLQNKSGNSAVNWGGVGTAFTALLMLGVNALAAFAVYRSVDSGQRLDVERNGKIVVSGNFINTMRWIERLENKWRITNHREDETPAQRAADSPYMQLVSSNASGEAFLLAEHQTGSHDEIKQHLVDDFYRDGTRDFIPASRAAPGISAVGHSARIARFAGSLFLFLWFVMLTFQGEGLELDLQRRRHPMWEWMLSHPAPPGAIFLAEMLSPIAANPIYWGAPLFVGVLYGMVYGVGMGALAGLLIGVPVAITVACLGKALEIGITLRLPPRSRGAMAGLMSWAGYATMMFFLVGSFVLPEILAALRRPLAFASALPSPWLAWFLGERTSAAPSFVFGIIGCLLVCAIVLAGSVWFSVWATNEGLSGNFASDSRPSRRTSGESHFSSRPLYRKEMLWFMRDRSAIVQTILIPITVASFQIFNLRGLLVHAQHNWNYLSGAAIFFGTYFLWILGPKSLASEGNALWIALTWPTGLESLLKAKAWLWSLISSALVALVLGYALFLFPTAWWKIALVAVAWFIFGGSMADKAVTLVTVTADSGEVQKIPSGRRWAAQLGMFTFAIGVITQQWHIAAMGIVYSWLTAAAMWQNFRARLPYLYDPWSETLPTPPTLMHAMIAISTLVEIGAAITGVIFAISGGGNIAIAQAVSYGICAVGVSIGTANFLGNREVKPRDIWRWLIPAEASVLDDEYDISWWRSLGLTAQGFLPALLVALGSGVALGVFAHAYLAVLAHIPYTAEILRTSREHIATIPYFKLSYGVMAVLFAPFAEEYLFRGLLFRALDREWGGWRAILGSAAFFAFYHPPMAWLPVFLLGTANALLFKKSRSLFPCVLLHMTYNAVVLVWS